MHRKWQRWPVFAEKAINRKRLSCIDPAMKLCRTSTTRYLLRTYLCDRYGVTPPQMVLFFKHSRLLLRTTISSHCSWYCSCELKAHSHLKSLAQWRCDPQITSSHSSSHRDDPNFDFYFDF